LARSTSARSGQHFQPALLRQVLEAVVVAEKVAGVLVAAREIVARSIEPVRHHRQRRATTLFARRSIPQRQVGLTRSG